MAAALVVGTAAAYLTFFFVEGSWSEAALNRCGRSEALPSSSVTVEWRWWPPGYECVFTPAHAR